MTTWIDAIRNDMEWMDFSNLEVKTKDDKLMFNELENLCGGDINHNEHVNYIFQL